MKYCSYHKVSRKNSTVSEVSKKASEMKRNGGGPRGEQNGITSSVASKLN